MLLDMVRHGDCQNSNCHSSCCIIAIVLKQRPHDSICNKRAFVITATSNLTVNVVRYVALVAFVTITVLIVTVTMWCHFESRRLIIHTCEISITLVSVQPGSPCYSVITFFDYFIDVLVNSALLFPLVSCILSKSRIWSKSMHITLRS